MKRVHCFSFAAIIALFCLSFTVSAADSAYTARDAGAGMIVINSENLHTADTILVFTPGNNSSTAEEMRVKGPNMPTVILLHGWSGCWKNWSDKYDIQRIADSTGFRIICPDGFYASWYVNHADSQKMQYRTFFDEEFFPQMKERFNLTEENTFITGLSMGGHGAISLFLNHPERYRAAGSMSGVLDLRDTKIKDLMTTCGDSTRLVKECCVERLESMKDTLKALNRTMIVSCGYSDGLFCSTEKFSAKCRQLGINHMAIFSPGVHSWAYWGYALQLHLTAFRRILNKENQGYYEK